MTPAESKSDERQSPAVWLTYAWADNAHGDIDFVAQELERAGLRVKLDRWTIQAGLPLWQQIEAFIQDPAQSDGWIVYATHNSLGSAPCREEWWYALDRALRTRGQRYPVIAVFPGLLIANSYQRYQRRPSVSVWG